MARDGSGNYQLPSGNPVVTNTIISSSGWANPTLSDIASALTQSLSRDGQTTPTADLTMGNFKLRSLANAIARTDAVNAGQIQDGGLVTLGSVSGTDTITASSAPAITAYIAGQTFDFIAAGANTTTSVTLNINALGAKNITKNGATALAIGDIQNGQSVRVRYDGTQLQMISPVGRDSGRLLNIQTFTSSGTYTPTAGTVAVRVRLVGGGGAGGGAPATGAGQVSVGSGGGSGSYSEGYFTSAFSGVTVTIGNGGAAVSGANGGNGAASSFGALMTAPGGSGGLVAGPSAPPFGAVGSSGGVAGTGGYMNSTGTGAGATNAANLSSFIGSQGGPSPLGGGGSLVASGGNGLAGTNGGGGGGTQQQPSSAALSGGAGGKGICIIEEFGSV